VCLKRGKLSNDLPFGVYICDVLLNWYCLIDDWDYKHMTKRINAPLLNGWELIEKNHCSVKYKCVERKLLITLIKEKSKWSMEFFHNNNRIDVQNVSNNSIGITKAENFMRRNQVR